MLFLVSDTTNVELSSLECLKDLMSYLLIYYLRVPLSEIQLVEKENKTVHLIARNVSWCVFHTPEVCVLPCFKNLLKELQYLTVCHGVPETIELTFTEREIAPGLYEVLYESSTQGVYDKHSNLLIVPGCQRTTVPRRVFNVASFRLWMEGKGGCIPPYTLY